MRKMVWFIFAATAFLASAGCVSDLANDNEPNSRADAPVRCQSDEYLRHLWQPASILDGMTLPKDTRVLMPGMAVTMDYRPDRLNILVGKMGRIERVYCG